MLYGLYLSAAGVLTNSIRQDVIANNLANAQTAGFKRDLSMFQQRRTEAAVRGLGSPWTDPKLEVLGGGMSMAPSRIDLSQGELEHTGNALDASLMGRGWYMVDQQGTQSLTRDGRFMVDRDGYLVLANDQGQRVLDASRQPIRMDPTQPIQIDKDGQITQAGQATQRLGVFDVPDPSQLIKRGGLLMSYPDLQRATDGTAQVMSGFVEQANVDPATELTQLMEAQRQLEANANMIRYQDQTLSRLVNDVGRIG